jgi:hypothetical protein
MADYIVVHSVKVATEFVPQTFGRLTTIGPKFRLPIGKQGLHRFFQVCQCECGDIIITVRRKTSTPAKSCGCAHREELIKRNTIHGRYKSDEYVTWKAMKSRCYSRTRKQYRDYGGRGIRVCDRWLEPNGQGFLNFLEDMGPMPQGARYTIERDRVNENYCPENCRWATYTEQARNRRSNINLAHNNKTQCLKDWAKDIGISESTLRSRIRLGWSVEKSLTTPIRCAKRTSLPPIF